MSFGDAIADVMLEAFRLQLQRHAGSAALELERYVNAQLNGVGELARRSGRLRAASCDFRRDSPLAPPTPGAWPGPW